MSCGVSRHEPFQIKTGFGKSVGFSKYGLTKPWLIYGLSLSFVKLDNKPERTKERIKVSIHGEAYDFVNIDNPLSFLLKFRSVL